MNIRETATIRSSNGIDEKCAKFIIDDVEKPFVLKFTTDTNEKYVFSAWVMSDADSTITVENKKVPVTTEWKRQKVGYTASGSALKIYFNKKGTYYFYKSQLEIGDVATDWSPSPEDIEESLKATNAKFELVVNKDTLKSEINALADTFTFTGNGFIVNSDNLQISEDGTIIAKNGNFTGDITTGRGKIGGWDIDEYCIHSTNEGYVYTEDGLKTAALNLGYIEFAKVFTVDDITYESATGVDGNGLQSIRVAGNTGTEYQAIVNAYGLEMNINQKNEDVHRRNMTIRDLEIYAIDSYEDFKNEVLLNTEGVEFNDINPITGNKKGEYNASYMRISQDTQSLKITPYEITTSEPLKLNGIFLEGKAINSSDGIGRVSLIKDGRYYYMRPYDAGTTCCGSSGHPWYKTYTQRLEVTEGRIQCLPSYENTVTYNPNLFVGTSGIFSRSTSESSRTIKNNIKNLGVDKSLDANKLYDLDVVQFKYNDGIVTDETDVRYKKNLPGFIIENMDEVYPIAIDKPSDNVRQWSWNEKYLIPPMLKLIQEQKLEIDELKEKANKILKTLENAGLSI